MRTNFPLFEAPKRRDATRSEHVFDARAKLASMHGARLRDSGCFAIGSRLANEHLLDLGFKSLNVVISVAGIDMSMLREEKHPPPVSHFPSSYFRHQTIQFLK